MATVRARKPGVWEVRVFTGRDDRGRPTQVSRTVRGTMKDAQRIAAELAGRPVAQAGRRRVADALDAWVEKQSERWAASSKRDQMSRVNLVKLDPIA
jgi:hypothetical protein